VSGKKKQERREEEAFLRRSKAPVGPVFEEQRNKQTTYTETNRRFSLFSSFFTNKLHRPRQFEQHGGHPRIGRREDAVLDLERREQQRHLSKPSQGGGRGVRFSRGFAKEGVGESFSHSQGWTRRQSEKVNVTYKREVH
jgi:hypothetical protein